MIKLTNSLTLINYFIVPRIGNSGPEHWQTHFEKSGNNFIRIEQQNWETPTCHDWIKTIDDTISNYDLTTVVLIGHSLGCSAIANWATAYHKTIKGALLVAPSDTESPQYTFNTKGFEKVPNNKIDFKTIVVASTNDPWVSIERANFFASNWGSEFINIGDAGHINVASGYGLWKDGMALLKKFSQSK